MRKYLFALMCGLALTTVGCQVTREWVISEATKIAEIAANQALDKVDDHLLPLIDEKVREEIDANNDGIWEQDELQDAISEHLSVVVSDIKTELTADTDKKLEDRLKDALTKGEGVKGVLALIALFILGKLGIKVKNGQLNAGDLFSKLKGTKEEEPEVKL